jgi:hypothetical protein
MVWMLLIGCGESATFEEVEAPADEVEVEEAPSGSEKAPDLQAPVDARPDEVQVKAPAPGQAWPPIVVPEGPREREWDWDFKHKGSTKTSRERTAERIDQDMTLDEINAVEMDQDAEGGEDPDWVYQSD